MKVVEVVGLAGSGKSTLTKKMIDELPSSYGRYRLRKTKWIFVIFKSFISNFVVLLRNILRTTKRNPIVPLLHFDASIQDIRSLKEEVDMVLVLDQGPIFNFISMNYYEFYDLNCIRQQQEMKEKLLEFGETLDGIIFLHAPLDKLIERVSKRGVDHQLKALSKEKKVEFLDRYYSDYTYIIKELREKCGVSILEIDTDLNNMDKTFNLASNFLTASK